MHSNLFRAAEQQSAAVTWLFPVPPGPPSLSSPWPPPPRDPPSCAALAHAFALQPLDFACAETPRRRAVVGNFAKSLFQKE